MSESVENSLHHGDIGDAPAVTIPVTGVTHRAMIDKALRLAAKYFEAEYDSENDLWIVNWSQPTGFLYYLPFVAHVEDFIEGDDSPIEVGLFGADIDVILYTGERVQVPQVRSLPSRLRK